MLQPSLAGSLQRRDFTAAEALLRFSGLEEGPKRQWRAYLLFHTGRHGAALDAYRSLAATAGSKGKSFSLPISSCLLKLGRFEEALEAAEKGPDCSLKTRLMLHSAAKLDQEQGDGSRLKAKAAEWEVSLASASLDAPLSLAALRYEQGEYQAALAMYEGLLQKSGAELHALHMYAAYCLYMMGDWQASAAHVAAYQAQHPDSILAANLHACLEFRASGAESALYCLRSLPALPQDTPPAALIRHNAVVFADGQGTLQVLPPLVGIVPEARLNLALLHCRRGELDRALALLRGFTPATALEHICVGVACALHGQAAGSPEHLRLAKQSFMAVGAWPTEQNTVPGRQCLASALLLEGKAEEALPLLESLTEACPAGADEALSWNLGTARAAAGEWAAAVEALQQLKSPALLADPCLHSCLARCLVHLGRLEEAWLVCVQAQQGLGAAPPVAHLLHQLAVDSFLVGSHLWSARAWHALENLQQRLGPQRAGTRGAAGALGGRAAGAMSSLTGQVVWEGKRAACAAALKEVVEGREEADGVLPELLGMLNRGSSHPQAPAVAAVIQQWAQEHAPAALEAAAA